MPTNISNVTTGPAQFLIGGASAGNEIGHLQGGATVSISPQNRVQNVDQYGSSATNVVHTGDDVKFTAPMAEWSVSVLEQMYDPGLDNLSGTSGNRYLGVGRSAGYFYQAQEAHIIPRVTSFTEKRCTFYRATPIGEISLTFNTDDDRVFSPEFQCMVDPDNQSDGNLIMRLDVD